jgi:hypothetical protein
MTLRAFAGVKGQPAWLQATSREHREALQETFLAHYAAVGIIKSAADLTGINRDTVDNWRKSDRVFAERMDRAKMDAADVAEAELRRRAIEGWTEPVFQGGIEVGTVRKFSDNMLALHIKALKPTEYRENIRAEVSGPDGGAISMQVLPTMQDHERQALRAVLEEAIRAQVEADADAGGVSAATPVPENVG